MLMKYNDFKTLSSYEMREVKGGVAEPVAGHCTQTGSNTYPNGTTTCDYYCVYPTSTWTFCGIPCVLGNT
jgi:hypothetical protein